jgi:hypothetical protein
LRDCADAELPVAVPQALAGDESLGELVLEDDSGESLFFFALFPKMGGRNFDAEADEDWLRLGAVLGRLHAVGGIREAPSRLRCDPVSLTRPLLQGLLDEDLVHPDLVAEFEKLCTGIIDMLAPRFEGLTFRRIHGDCHRGNILDRPGSGLLIIEGNSAFSSKVTKRFCPLIALSSSLSKVYASCAWFTFWPGDLANATTVGFTRAFRTGATRPSGRPSSRTSVTRRSS